MKAKPFKSHEKLGITFAEYGALLGTLSMLENGILIPTNGNKVKRGKHLFNMSRACKMQECGTVGCIGGHMALIMGMATEHEAGIYVAGANRSRALYPLFFPDELSFLMASWSEIPLPVTIQAIRNFLTTGKPQWRKVYKGQS